MGSRWRIKKAKWFLLYVRMKKIPIWVMSQIKDILSRLYWQSKNSQNPLQVFINGWIVLRTTELLPLPLKHVPDLYKATKCLHTLCCCVFSWETQHSDILKSILLKTEAIHGNCQLQIKPGSCFPHPARIPVLFLSRAEITPDTYFGVPCVG